MDISATSPFSQIRAHGGSNHLFMPMSTPNIVRVTRSTSSYINRMYPGETSELLPPRSVELLEGAGHAAIQFMPTVMIVLGQRFSQAARCTRDSAGDVIVKVPAGVQQFCWADLVSTGED